MTSNHEALSGDKPYYTKFLCYQKIGDSVLGGEAVVIKRESALKALGAILVVALVSSMFVGCLGSSSGDIIPTIKGRGKLIVGTSSGFVPFEMINTSSGKMEGFDIDIAQAIADELGVNLEVRDMEFAVLIGAVKIGTIDMVIAGMSITPDRNLSITFSNPYFDADQAIVVRASDTSINSPADLAGKKVAVNLETTGDYWVTDNLPDSQIIRLPFAYTTFLELSAGMVDAVVIDKPVADAYSAQNPTTYKVVYTILTGEHYGIAMKQSSEDLVAFVNQVLVSMKDSGEMQQIVSKWF